MLLGVVSDTHNNLKNIDQIISLFNRRSVDLVIHTGDITNANSLRKFAKLESKLFLVFGNTDRSEFGLKEVAAENNFEIQEPPYQIKKCNREIVIFHEPDLIDNFLDENKDIDLVLHGHTHRYREEFYDRTLVFNPGESAGMQKGKNAIGFINLNTLNVERVFF